MGVLDGLAPERVFGFFEELCAIPHGSGNTGAISTHLAAFARARARARFLAWASRRALRMRRIMRRIRITRISASRV